jgi:APA family basic amino acid/polyamine antiporter
VQWFGVKWGGAAQDITSALKALVFIGLIAVCFYFGSRNPFSSSIVPEHEGSIFVAYLVALQAMIYTYDGWSAVAYFSEEVEGSGKNIPRSMFGGVTIVVIIYLLMNLAFLSVVPLGTIAGKGLAAGIVAQHLFRAYGDLVIRSLVIVSLLSAVNSNVLMAPRVIFAMARDRLFWRGATEVNKGGTPDIALLVSSLVAAAFIVWSAQFTKLIALMSFFFVVNYALSFTSLIALRRKEPDTPRPFRTIGYPVTTILALIASLLFLAYAIKADLRQSIYALVMLAFSVPVFFIIRTLRHDH